MRRAFYGQADIEYSVKKIAQGKDFMDLLNEATVLAYMAYASDDMSRSALDLDTAFSNANTMIETTFKNMHPLRGSLEGNDKKILTENEEFLGDLFRKWQIDKMNYAVEKYGDVYLNANKTAQNKMEQEFVNKSSSNKDKIQTVIDAQKAYENNYNAWKKQFPDYLKTVQLDDYLKSFNLKYRPETDRVIKFLKEGVLK